MKKLLFLLFFGFTLQGCENTCFLAGGVCGQAGGEDSEDPSKNYEQRAHIWGLKLQIGNYLLDSIFNPYRDGRHYDVTMDNIENIVPNYREVPHIGRVYGWDTECAEDISFIPKWEYKNGNSPRNIYIRVDPLGYFDFSIVLKTYPFEDFGPDKYPNGSEYYVKPEFQSNEALKIVCFNLNSVSTYASIDLSLKP